MENPIFDTKMTMDASTCPFVAVLAVGISNCPRLHEKLEGSEASRVVDRCLKRIERSVDAIGGRIVQTGSGEAIAIFDAADAVVHAAIEMQQRIANLPPVSGVKMAIRVGISCGLASNPDQPVDDGLVKETARLMGIARSGRVLAHAKIRKALPEALRRMATDTDLTLPNESGHNEPVMEIVPFEASAADSAKNGSPDAAGSTEVWLRLNYGLDTVVLNEHKPVIVMGRDGACEVIIRNPRASRRHATIQRRGSLIVLIDRSTNGTFVTIDGDPTQFVKHGECPLRGSGMIAFSSKQATTPDTDCIRFECA